MTTRDEFIELLAEAISAYNDDDVPDMREPLDLELPHFNWNLKLKVHIEEEKMPDANGDGKVKVIKN